MKICVNLKPTKEMLKTFNKWGKVVKLVKIRKCPKSASGWMVGVVFEHCSQWLDLNWFEEVK